MLMVLDKQDVLMQTNIFSIVLIMILFHKNINVLNVMINTIQLMFQSMEILIKNVLVIVKKLPIAKLTFYNSNHALSFVVNAIIVLI